MMYKLCSILLTYPEQELLDELANLRKTALKIDGKEQYLTEVIDYLANNDLLYLQQQYVQTFDQTPAHSLHLFEHIHGEDRARGSAMVDLLAEYQNAGFTIPNNELPDYLPLFLEFLSQIKGQQAQSFLDQAIDVINHIAKHLTANKSIYANIFKALVASSNVIPKALTTAPIKDMDDALAKFGVQNDGAECLLTPSLLISD